MASYLVQKRNIECEQISTFSDEMEDYKSIFACKFTCIGVMYPKFCMPIIQESLPCFGLNLRWVILLEW
jgi:hypothetical protein